MTGREERQGWGCRSLLGERSHSKPLQISEAVWSRGGRPGLPVPNKPAVSVDIETNPSFAFRWDHRCATNWRHHTPSGWACGPVAYARLARHVVSRCLHLVCVCGPRPTVTFTISAPSLELSHAVVLAWLSLWALYQSRSPCSVSNVGSVLVNVVLDSSPKGGWGGGGGFWRPTYLFDHWHTRAGYAVNQSSGGRACTLLWQAPQWPPRGVLPWTSVQVWRSMVLTVCSGHIMCGRLQN